MKLGFFDFINKKQEFQSAQTNAVEKTSAHHTYSTPFLEIGKGDLTKPYISSNYVGSGGYVRFGGDNLFPQIINQMYYTSPLLGGIIEFKKNAVSGGGFEIQNTKDDIRSQIEIKAFIKKNNGLATWSQSAFTGGTVTGATIFTDGVTANTISATTYQNLPPITIGVSLDGQGNVITTGSTGYRVVERAGNVTHWYVVGDVTGSTIFDIKRSGTSIIGAGNKPTLSNQIRNNATPSSWTSIAIAANDELEFVVDSASTITKAWLFVQIT